MTLKELQNMIKEEFAAFQNEAEDDVDVSVSAADVDVDMGDEMGDEVAPEGEEDVLRKIYDLLALHFEGGAEVPAEDELGDEVGDDIEDVEDVEETYMENKEADLEEGDGYDGKTKGSTKDAPYTSKPGGKGGTGYDAGSKALQERFQKLANIIK